MKHMVITLVGTTLLAALASAQETSALKTQQDKVSYGIGVSVARNFKQQGLDVNLDMVIKGIRDDFAGGKLLMTEDELKTTLTAFQEELRKTQAHDRKIAADDNKKAGDAFRADNKKKEGVVTLPDGLQYKILKAGTGNKPVETDTVEVRYTGTTPKAIVFDKTDPNGPPATFSLTRLTAGWKEALQLMPVGSKWQLVVPPELAYGMQGSGRDIGPNATLLFDVELLGIKAETVKK